MTWDKLVDRCLLFVDAPGGLLKALLKEAEQELSNKLELYDSLYTITIPATNNGGGIWSHRGTVADHNYIKLPNNYLRDIAVSHQGRKLRKMTEEEIFRKSDTTVSSGTPMAYGISGEYIIFDSAPASGDTFVLHYKSLLTDVMTNKVVNVFYYHHAGPTIYLDTTLGSALDTKKIAFENQVETLSAGDNTVLVGPSGVMDIYQGNKASQDPSSVSIQEQTEILGSKYTVTAFTAENSLLGSAWTHMNGAMATIAGYRDIAPLIPDNFHIDLCSYAMAIASAKTAPELYDKHWAAWLMNMDNLINEAQDRDLIFSIREEI